MRLLAGLMLGLLLAQSGETTQTRAQSESLELCDIVKNSESYNNKEITFRATWRYGFEWTYLYCLHCETEHIWVQASEEELDSVTRRVLTSKPKGAGIVNVTLTGVFKTGGRYGHQSGYRHEFIVKKAWNLVVLSKGMKNPEKEKEIEAKYACGGTSPK